MQDPSPSELADFQAAKFADQEQAIDHMRAVRHRVEAIEKAVDFMEGRQDAHAATASDYSRHWAAASEEAQACSSQIDKQKVQDGWDVYRTDVLSQIFRQSCFAGFWAAWCLPRKLT